MNHYVYLIINNINNKKYIGKRSCKCSIENDSYMGSGIALKQAQKKYGIDNFSKHILLVCDSEEHAYEEEKSAIGLARAVESDRYYNIAYGGKGGLKGIQYSQDELRERRKNVVNIFTGKIYKDIDIIKKSKDLRYYEDFKTVRLANNLSMFNMKTDDRTLRLINLEERFIAKQIYVYEEILDNTSQLQIIDWFKDIINRLKSYDDIDEYYAYNEYERYIKNKENKNIDEKIDEYENLYDKEYIDMNELYFYVDEEIA